VDIRLKEHQQHIQLDSYKSAIAEHSIGQGHHIQFHNTTILTTKARYMIAVLGEAIDIELYLYNIERGDGFFSADRGNLLLAP
jgi:hypothetical protein